MQTFFKKLNRCFTVDAFKKTVVQYFLQEANGDYIPAILDYTVYNAKENARFYAKLTLQPKEYTKKSFWQKQILEESLPMQTLAKQNANVHNVVTQVNFKGKKVYAINRHFVTIDSVQMSGQVQKNILLEYCANTQQPILQEASSGEAIFIYKKFLQTILKKSFMNRYILALDFYYISPKLQLQSSINEDCILEKKTAFTKMYGNILLENKVLQENIERANQHIFVYNLLEKNFTPLHKYPLQMRADMGILFFSLDILQYLKENFYNYGLYLVDKKTKKIILVDILQECVAFWKSEFLKLAEQQQKKLEKYNQKKCPNTIISQAMYIWQIEGKMNYVEYMPAYQSLAEFFFQTCKDRVIAHKISFFPPKNVIELQQFIQRVLSFLGIQLQNLHMKGEQEEIFLQILQGVAPENFDIDRYYNGFCYILQRRIEDETIAV